MSRFWKIKKQEPVIYVHCEWKTEVEYFKQLSRILKHNFKIITNDLEWWTQIYEHPEKIKKIIDNRIKHDKTSWLTQEVFVVFDLDIFEDRSKLQNAQNKLTDYKLVYNNECFEYWLLSHFKKCSLWRWKKRYLNEIRKFLPKLPEWRDYKLTWNEDYDWLNRENIETAIEHVKELNKSYWNLKDRDPYSNVYEIIEFLEKD